MIHLDSLIAKVLPEAIAVRHDLHAHPQLSYEETYASGLVQDYLKKNDIPFQAKLASTGVVGWLTPDRMDRDLPAVGLRADMDGLPIDEATGATYASRNAGVMHACGHDGHMAILLASAKILAQLPDQLPRPVKFLFQPAEECGAGAEKMIQAGALTAKVGGRRVGAMFGLHGSPYLPVGWVATRAGALLAGCSDFEIEVLGSGGHAALPQDIRDPVVAAAALVTALQTLVSRNLDPTKQPAILSICRIRAGETNNVVPDRVSLAGTLRAFADDVFTVLRRRLVELAEHTAAGFGCRATVQFSPTYPAVINDSKATAFAIEVAEAATGKERLFAMEAPALASEDFSFYGQQVPSCFSFIGVAGTDGPTFPSLHTPQFDFNDAALATGIKLMCGYALAADQVV